MVSGIQTDTLPGSGRHLRVSTGLRWSSLKGVGDSCGQRGTMLRLPGWAGAKAPPLSPRTRLLPSAPSPTHACALVRTRALSHAHRGKSHCRLYLSREERVPIASPESGSSRWPLSSRPVAAFPSLREHASPQRTHMHQSEPHTLVHTCTDPRANHAPPETRRCSHAYTPIPAIHKHAHTSSTHSDALCPPPQSHPRHTRVPPI